MIKSTFTRMAVGVLAAATLAVPAFAEEAKSEKNIVETAVAAGNFTTLVKLVKAADLAETLSGAGPFTVFAPTDEAFSKVDAKTLEALGKPENKEKLAAVLKYHVVAGKVMAEDAKKLDGKSAKTVEGSEIKIAVADGKVKINDATVVKADIGASNGVIHVIDSVLLPPAAK